MYKLPQGLGAGRTVLRFVIAGGVVYAVDFTTLWALHARAGVPLGLATTVAFCCAFVANLTINRSFTFAASGSVGRQAAKLLVLVGVNYVSTLAIVVGLSHVWGAFLASKTIATGLNAVFNYFTYRHWVFKPTPAAPSAGQPESVPVDRPPPL